jgi:regulator of sirC expression with transglutaminase-like and TPR domain
MNHRLSFFALLFIFSFLPLRVNYAGGNNSLMKYSGQSVFDIVNVPEENIDIGLWALIIAKEYDISVDVPKYLARLDDMSMEIKRMLAGRTKDMDKFLSVKMFLYDSGTWNTSHPFSYDLDDPLGKELKSQLLSTYIDKYKGNCVSMPTLFLALMERVDPRISFTGVKAPLHLFCRLKDKQTGDVWNVETTNGGHPARNQWYIETMHISQVAVDKGTYLKDLTKKEYIAELLSPLISKERRNGNLEKALEYTELVLKLSPNSVLGLVSKGALLAETGYQKSNEGKLSDEEKKYYGEESKKYIEKARSLGWQPRTKEEKDEYLESVKIKKAKG